MALPKPTTLELRLEFLNPENPDKDGALYVIFNRPNRKNAITTQMYNEISDTLDFAKKDERIKILTGKGDYYSSGNDLSAFMGMDISNTEAVEQKLDEARQTLRRFVISFLRFPKILIAAVNGPAIGVAATTLAHCDFVYCTETATFNTPFVTLGQTPEACSSILFPQKMGFLKANEILILGKKIDAKQALEYKLVNDVLPSSKFHEKISDIVKEIVFLPSQALLTAKSLSKNAHYLDEMEKISNAEVEALVVRWKSEEFMQSVMNFMTRKTKSNL